MRLAPCRTVGAKRKPGPNLPTNRWCEASPRVSTTKWKPSAVRHTASATSKIQIASQGIMWIINLESGPCPVFGVEPDLVERRFDRRRALAAHRGAAEDYRR